MLAVALALVLVPLIRRGRREGRPVGVFALALTLAFVIPVATVGVYMLVGTPQTLDGVAKANYKWTSLDYKDPTVRVVGPTAIVRFTFVGEQEFTDGKKTPQNLHILMNWQKQGSDWKLLSRAATKL